MKAVYKESRKIGDAIPIVSVRDGHENPPVAYADGVIVAMTKKVITVQYNGEKSEKRFYRASGLMVGFNYPTNTLAIAPETSKEMS